MLVRSILCLCLLGFALGGWQSGMRAEQAADEQASAEGKDQAKAQEEALRKTRLVEAHLALERTMNHCQRDEIAQGLVWLARGPEVVPEDEAELQLSFRRQLRAWSRHLHALKQVLPIPSDLKLQLALSPDGKLLATGRDKPAGVQLWDAVTGKALGKPIPLPGTPWHVAFSRTGEILVIACYDESDERNAIRFWDVATRRPLGEPILLREARGDSRLLDRLDFSPDGKRLVTFRAPGGRERVLGIRLWEVPTGKPIGELLDTNHVRTAVFSPDGKTLLTGSDEPPHEVRLWNAQTGKPIGKPIEPGYAVTAAAFSPDSKTFVLGGLRTEEGVDLPGVVQVFETATRKAIPECGQLLPREVDHVAFGPEGATILAWYWGDRNGLLVQMFRRPPDISGWLVIGSPIPVPLVPRGKFAFSADGRSVLLVSDLWQARLWDTQTGQPLGDIPQTEMAAEWVGSDPDGKTMLIANGSDIRRCEIALAQPGRKLEGPREGGFYSMAFSPDGKKVAMAIVQNGRSEVRFWDPVTAKLTGERIQFGDGKREVFFVAYSPDGKVLLTVDASYPPKESAPATARLWDATTRQLIGDPIPVQWSAEYWTSREHTIAFSPDSKHLLVARGKVARLYDAATGKPAGKPLEHDAVIRAVAFSPDGKRILTGGDDKTARFWEATTGQPVGEALRHQAAVTFVAFSPDGKKVLTNAGQTARLWQAATGQPIGAPIRHGVPDARFSPDGKTVLMAALDLPGGKNWDAVRLWDAQTGKPRGPCLHHGVMIVDMAFSPDGRTVMTAGSGTYGTEGIQFWDAATGRPLGKVLWTHWYDRLRAEGVSAVFSPDSRTLLAKTTFVEPRPFPVGDLRFDEARLFAVPPPVEGDAARLRLWVEVITGRELDAGGEIADLDAQTWQQRWQQLHKLGGPP
jgi:WD40 repeat protein